MLLHFFKPAKNLCTVEVAVVRLSPQSNKCTSLIYEPTERERMRKAGANMQRTGGRQTERSLAPLSYALYLSVSVCVCASCLLQQFHNPPTSQPTSPGARAAPFHAHTDGTQHNNRKGPLRSLVGPVSNLPGGGSCYYH